MVAAGGSKSSAICYSVLVLSKKYPGYRCAICRKTTAALRLTTFEEMKQTLKREGLNERKPGQKDDKWDYRINDFGGEILFKNGSRIHFLGLDLRGDEDLQRLGSTNIDDAYIDEAGEVAFEAYQIAKSRIGRGPASIMYKRPGKILLSCNPSQNFLREQFYDPYENLGGGEFQEWKIGQTVDEQGKKIDAYRCFLRLTCYDNPFLPDSYIENLKSLEPKQRKRLYEGDWNYSDDSDSLFTSDILSKSIIYELPEPKTENGQIVFNKFIGVDVADSGGDATIATLIDNGVIADQIELKADKNSDVPIARQYADKLETFASKHRFTKNEARNIAIEKNGVGVGLVSQMQIKGWRITEYLATGKNRSSYIYKLSRDLDDGHLKIYYKIPLYEELRRELQAHKVNYDGQEPKVCPKAEVRALLSRSPDISDSCYIANYIRSISDEHGSHIRKIRSVSL
ncbi:MAG: phage terminase large subunit [Methanobrevibacter sp.]|nr:phage terminase large subunit [Methanobrevibacter sp.]